VCDQSLVSEPIKSASLHVAFDRGVELTRVEFIEPRAESRQLPRGKLFDGLLKVFGSSHEDNIALVEKGRKSSGFGV